MAKRHSLLALPLRDQAVLVEAIIMLACARGLIRFLAFRRWKHLIQIDRSGTTLSPSTHAGEPESSERRIGRLVRMAARNVPFKAVCLPQAMAAQWMLRRRGQPSQLVIGADRTIKQDDASSGSYDLHAWLICHDNIITGRREHHRFKAFSAGSAASDHGD